MAKPGMTGLWQVSGRNNVSYDTRVYFDTWYAKNWSLWNDIVILLKTAESGLEENWGLLVKNESSSPAVLASSVPPLFDISLIILKILLSILIN